MAFPEKGRQTGMQIPQAAHTGDLVEIRRGWRPAGKSLNFTTKTTTGTQIVD